jgi:hypothetical protein
MATGIVRPIPSFFLGVLAPVAITGAMLSLLVSGCKDQAKESATKARASVDSLVVLAGKDVAELERGLPEGANKLASLYAKNADPHQDVPAVRTALLRMRRDVPDLNIAKSTFFALADEHGIAIRNDLETDAMAGQNLLTLFPELAKAESGSFVTTNGAFPTTSKPGMPDRDFVAAAPIKKEDGSVGGILVTGWSYRRFAYYLQEMLKRELADQAKAAHDDGKLPIVYVALFDKSEVYSAPQTPDVNEKALKDAKLLEKTTTGPFEGTVTITDRAFGYAAARDPKLGDGVGIVVLRSEI